MIINVCFGVVLQAFLIFVACNGCDIVIQDPCYLQLFHCSFPNAVISEMLACCAESSFNSHVLQERIYFVYSDWGL